MTGQTFDEPEWQPLADASSQFIASHDGICL